METRLPVLKVPRFTEKLAHELIAQLLNRAEYVRVENPNSPLSNGACKILVDASKHISRVINRQADKREKLLKMILLSRWIYTGGDPRKMADVNDMRWILSDPYAYLEMAFNNRHMDHGEKILDLLLSGDLERSVNLIAGAFEESRDSLTVRGSQRAYNDMMEDLLQ